MKGSIATGLIAGLLTATLAYAQPTATEKETPFFTEPFNYNQYTRCQTSLQTCGKALLGSGSMCANERAKNNTNCAQLLHIAEVINVPITAVTVQPFASFNVLIATFFADGQKQYYLISPQGELINTILDPRKIDPDLAQKYAKNNFLVVNMGMPAHLFEPDGSQSFIVTERITEGCLACPIVGWATLRFKFNKAGALDNIKLDNFSSQQDMPHPK